jgi:fatty acid synthase
VKNLFLGHKNITFNVMTEDIVISGIAGRFPECDNMDEFAYNLYNNLDMVTEDDRRWPTG